MTFKQAYDHEMKYSAEFREHDRLVKSKKPNDQKTYCLLFSPNLEEVFYYGFDGVDVCKGKHSAKRAKYLLESGQVDLIL